MVTTTLVWGIVNGWCTSMLVVAMAVAQKVEFLRLWSNAIILSDVSAKNGSVTWCLAADVARPHILWFLSRRRERGVESNNICGEIP